MYQRLLPDMLDLINEDLNSLKRYFFLQMHQTFLEDVNENMDIVVCIYFQLKLSRNLNYQELRTRIPCYVKRIMIRSVRID